MLFGNEYDTALAIVLKEMAIVPNIRGLGLAKAYDTLVV